MLKRTKIVATIGPACSSVEVLKEMVLEGCNVVRMNFSHGDYEDHAKVLRRIRQIDIELNTHTAILADLQGPKIRIGLVKEGGANLTSGSRIIISTQDVVGDESVISTNYTNFPRDVSAGEKVLLDDGKIELVVVSSNGKDSVECDIVHGGILTSKKGINLPNTGISLPCLTEKDLKDLDFALDHDVDWVGLSFVRSAKDVVELKSIIKGRKKHAKVIAKIEKPEAIEEIDEIIAESDAIMVARGDLGVEIPMQRVPIIQKMLIQKCIRSAKPVIVATQMMESMITNVTPTRAEVNDVANAVMDGADAVMLSAETSVGKFPVKVIQAMTKILQEVEKYDNVYYHETMPEESKEERYITDSICFNACRLAKRVDAAAIVTMTHSGYTGFKISSQRPKGIIYCFTGNRKLLTLMSLVWGVKVFYYDKMVSTDHTISDIRSILRNSGEVKDGEFIINIASMPISEMGMSNMLKLSKA